MIGSDDQKYVYSELFVTTSSAFFVPARSSNNPKIPARTEAKRIPIFDSSINVMSSKARLVMNSETVKPIPAVAASPMSDKKFSPGGADVKGSFIPSQVMNVIPKIFPIIKPRPTPQVTVSYTHLRAHET